MPIGEEGIPVSAIVGSELEVHFIDVGQADSVFIRCGDASMLIDGGNVADGSLVVSYLDKLGVTYIDYVVCTHAHEDHVGGLAGVLAAYEAGAVFCPVDEFDTKAFSNFVKYAEQQELSLECPEAGSVLSLGEAAVTVLGPRRDYSNVNNTSIVLRLDFMDTSFIFTGDAERESETDILDDGCNVKCDVLFVGHHGSGTSTSYRFLYEAQPDYAVISVGENNDYGHPHEEVMSRLHDADVQVYRTDMQGSIICVSDGESVHFTVSKNSGADTNPESQLYPAETAPIYIGNLNSKKFHLDTCSGLPAEGNRIYFESRAEAVNAGYEPCGRCKP